MVTLRIILNPPPPGSSLDERQKDRNNLYVDLKTMVSNLKSSLKSVH